LETPVKKVWWKRIAWIAGGAFAVYVLVEILLAGRNLPPMPPAQSGIALRGGHVVGNKITTKSWTFDYENASLSPDGTTGTIEGVRNGIVYRKGKPHLRISAQTLSFNTQTLDFTAIGKVRVQLIHDPEQRSFETDFVEWTNGTKLLHLDHPCYVRSAGGPALVLQHVTINFDKSEVLVGQIGGSFIQRR
jgi:hypothetical protein